MFLSLVIAGSFTLIISATIARNVSVEEFGIYSIVMSIKGVVILIACFGIPTALAKLLAEFSKRNPQEMKSIAKMGLIYVLILSILSITAYILLAKAIGEGLYDEPRVSELIPYSALAVFSGAFLATVSGIVQGLQNVRLLIFVQISAPILSLVTIVVMLMVADLRGVFAGYFVAQSIVVIGALLFVRGSCEFPASIPNTERRFQPRRILHLSLPVMIGAVMVGPTYWIGSTLLTIISGLQAMGYFSIALVIFNALAIVPGSVVILLMPRVSELSVERHERIGELMTQVVRSASILMFPLMFGVAVFSRHIVAILYGSSYSEAADSVYLISIAGYLFAVASTIGAMIIGTGRMWIGFGLNVIWGMLFLALAASTIPQWDHRGLAGTFACSYGAHLIISFLVSKRVFGIDLKRAYVPVFGSALLFAAGFVALTVAVETNITAEVSVYLLGSVLVLWLGKDAVGPVLSRFR